MGVATNVWFDLGPFHEREPVPDTVRVTRSQELDGSETYGKTKHYWSKEKKKESINKMTLIEDILLYS